ncbi:protein adenylyltransferase SelO [Ferrimonas gelatinilytica]|uniref:Protein nucleotidyltransferase YdiU n=1 Tax=Ferrimonas gelatinilytica TaxID=1255257 RepID=A0ABP9RVC1_9GAMM
MVTNLEAPRPAPDEAVPWQPGIEARLPWLGQGVQASPLTQPRWLGWSDEMAATLGIQRTPELLARFAGQHSDRIPVEGFAQVYSGHQFGGYTPRLGDGRGLHLGQIDGWELFLKGSGPTPFSRGGDGRAVLRSAVREFLISEAMHHLGIRTTRALAVLGSDTPVWREQQETAAITVRVSRTHLRFGHFEYLFYNGEQAKLRALLEDTLETLYPDLVGTEAPLEQWLLQVVVATAQTVADWQAFGFCHGVLNTDNMSILGETFDYGPFAFLNRFEPGFICNHSDHDGRYAFDQQPGIGLWNLNKLALTLTPFIDAKRLQGILAEYEPALLARYLSRMAARMGLERATLEDLPLITELLGLFSAAGADYHLTFRALAEQDPNVDDGPLFQRLGHQTGFAQWYRRYRDRLGGVGALSAWQRHRAEANPAVILRTHLAQEAITGAERGDLRPLARLHRALCRPYDPRPQDHPFIEEAPEWSQSLVLSCSS